MVYSPGVFTPFIGSIGDLTRVSPFTHRDNETYLRILSGMIHYLREDGTFMGEINAELQRIIDEFRAGLTEWEDFFNAFMLNVNANIVVLNENNFLRIVSPLTYGAIGDGVANDAAAIQTAVDATPAGGILKFPAGKTFKLGNSVVNVSTPITVLGGSFTSTTGKAFNVTGNGVTIDGVAVDGPGTGVPYAAGNAAVSVQGAIGTYLTGIAVRNCVITGMRDTGIRLEFVDGFTVEGNSVNGFRYGGVMANSVRNGDIDNNDIRHAVQDTVGLSYGIAVTDIANEVIHRSQNVEVSNNRVEDVADWEGIDTHGGKNIRFVDNTIIDCRYGVVLTVGSDTRKTAPESCLVTGNNISAPNLIQIKNCTGVVIGGAGVNNVNQVRADAVIFGNVYDGLTAGLSLPTSTGGMVDLKKSRLDTGWVDASKYGHFNTGYESNSAYPVKMRVQNDVVKFEGAVSLNADVRSGTVFFVLDNPDLIPTYDRLMGVGRGTAAPYDSFTLSVNTAGSYRCVFPATIPTTNFMITGEYQL